MKMVTNLRVQFSSVRASEENCKPILLRGTADCLDCSSGQCNGSYDYVRAVHPIDGENGLAAASARAPSFQSLASARPRLAGARYLLAQHHNAREGLRNHVLVLFFLCSHGSAIILRWPLDDKLTPLTHGCSPVGSRTGGASIKLTNTWPQSRSGSCAAGAPKKPPLGRRVLSDRARIQRLGSAPSPMEQLERRRVPMVRAPGIHACTPQIPDVVRFLPPVDRGLGGCLVSGGSHRRSFRSDRICA